MAEENKNTTTPKEDFYVSAEEALTWIRRLRPDDADDLIDSFTSDVVKTKGVQKKDLVAGGVGIGSGKPGNYKSGVVGVKEFNPISQKADEIVEYAQSVERIKNAFARLDALGNPEMPTSLNLDISSESRIQAAREGAGRMKAPEKPELYSTDPNRNQLYMTLAMQAVSGIAGVAGGEPTAGAIGAVGAGKAGMDIIQRDVEKREKLNVVLEKAYMDAMTGYNKNVNELTQKLIADLGKDERELLKQKVIHWNNNESRKIDVEEETRKRKELELDKVVKSEKAMTESMKLAKDSLKVKAENLKNKKNVLLKNVSNKNYADRTNAMMSLGFAKISMARLQNKMNHMKFKTTGKSALYTQSPALAAFSLSNRPPDQQNNGFLFTNELRDNMTGYFAKYNPQTLAKNPALIDKIPAIKANIAKLMDYLKQTDNYIEGWEGTDFFENADIYMTEDKAELMVPKNFNINMAGLPLDENDRVMREVSEASIVVLDQAFDYFDELDSNFRKQEYDDSLRDTKTWNEIEKSVLKKGWLDDAEDIKEAREKLQEIYLGK